MGPCLFDHLAPATFALIRAARRSLHQVVSRQRQLFGTSQGETQPGTNQIASASLPETFDAQSSRATSADDRPRAQQQQGAVNVDVDGDVVLVASSPVRSAPYQLPKV